MQPQVSITGSWPGESATISGNSTGHFTRINAASWGGNTIELFARPEPIAMHVGAKVILHDIMTLGFEGDESATFSARELREILEWVRANRAPSRMPAIDAAPGAPPDEGV